MFTYFVVQSFTAGRKGAVVADLPIEARSAEDAKRKAERLSRVKPGVVAFSRTGDPLTGDYDDAVVLASYGNVPDESQELRLAS